MITGRLSLNYEKYLVLASAALLTKENVERKEEFDKSLPEERDKNLSEESISS